MKYWFIGLLVVAVLLPTAAGAAGPSAKLDTKWQALLGEWKGENASGATAGACGFHLDLSEHIIVRTNHAVLAAGGRDSKPHDDLMVIYPGTTPDKASAIYFDNEGHVIEYAAEWSADGATLTFLSRAGAGPQFRLIYKKVDPKTFSVTFEMAPPGQTSFKPYTTGTIRRG